MEDHGHHHHHHHQGYDIQDLCHLISASRASPAGLFPPLSPNPDLQRDPFHGPPPGYFNHHLLSSIQGLVPGPDHVRTPCIGGGGGGAVPESPLVVTPSTNSPWTGDGDVGGDGSSGGTSRGNLKMECDRGGDGGGGGSGGGRWPRQETLTLLEVRSRLDPRFKQANHKGPLWDEVSRILLEEHGYHRSGKKCREKFENLYKYYKKTKEGKAGRQDGKHYRFFRQLEALYGESAAATNQIQSSSLAVGDSTRAPLLFQRPEMVTPRKNDAALGPSNSTTGGPCEEACCSLLVSTDETDVSLECYYEDENKKAGNKGKGKRNWKEKIRVFVDSGVRKLVEKQEEWLRRMTRALEEKEKERVIREEEWRRREAERFEREQEFWEKERAWIEARDAAFMDAVRRFSVGDREIEKWKVDCLSRKEALGKKKRKELESRYSFSYGDKAVPERHKEIEHMVTARGSAAMTRNMPNAYGIITNGSSSSPCDSHNDNDEDNSSTGVPRQDLNCLRYLIGDPRVGENSWDNYELKLNK